MIISFFFVENKSVYLTHLFVVIQKEKKRKRSTL